MNAFPEVYKTSFSASMAKFYSIVLRWTSITIESCRNIVNLHRRYDIYLASSPSALITCCLSTCNSASTGSIFTTGVLSIFLARSAYFREFIFSSLLVSAGDTHAIINVCEWRQANPAAISSTWIGGTYLASPTLLIFLKGALIKNDQLKHKIDVCN